MSDVVQTLERLAFAYDLLDEHPQRARAFKSAARNLRKLKRDIPRMYQAGELAEIPGVGKGVLEIAGEVLSGRKPASLTELEARIPAGLFEIGRIRGVGPKKVRTLWRELGLTTLAELEYACHENRLVELSGFGAKTQQKVLDGLATVRAAQGRFRMDQATHAARVSAEALAPARVQVAGELRRGCELVESVTVLAAGDREDLAARIAASQGLEAPQGVEVLGLPAWRTRAGAVPVTVVPCAEPDQTWGVLAILLTGSAEHVTALQERAAARGGTLGPAGLFDGTQLVACATEEDVYAHLELHRTTPERREADVPLVQIGKARPRLLRREDLQGALHNHTTASDGVHSLEAMRDAATALGLRYLGISDHSQTASYAGGLVPDALREQRRAIDALNAARGDAAEVLAGVESDILEAGDLDYEPEVLGDLDFVVASVHTRYKQDAEAATARMVHAASNPFTDVVGHPTGRLLLGRAANTFDVEAMLRACATSGTAVELNANPQRLDLNAEWLAVAKELGVLVSIAADAHSTQGLGDLDYGVAIARRAGLTAEDVLNTRSADELRAWTRERRSRGG